ncbi:MAG: protein kinase domain-containing protein [Actinomycetota bacterium]
MTDKPIGRGTVLAGRFRLEDLVQDTDGARFWRAVDQILARSVAVNVIDTADPRADALLVAARTSATVTEGHFLRVLDAAQEDGVVYVVHEWGSGMSLDKILAEEPLTPRRAAWLVKEVADAITVAHQHGIAHGRLVPENVMVTEAGSVKLIGFVVDAVLHGRRQAGPGGRVLSDHESDVHNLAALLYATLVGKWPGEQTCNLPPAPTDHERILRPRQVRAGVPRALDAICDQVLNPGQGPGSLETAQEISAALSDFIGDAVVPMAGHEPTVALPRDAAAGLRARPTPEASPHPSPEETSPDTRPGTAPGRRSGAAGAGRHAAPSADPEATQAVPLAGAEELDATQAAGPFFDDDEPTRRVAPPPPPPLPEPEERPLFAPGPPRAATESQAPAATGAGARAVGHSHHGTGSLPPVWGPDTEGRDETDWASRDSSRDWLKLAAAVAVILLLVVAIIFAFNLGRDSGGTDTAPGPEESPSQAPAGPLRIAAVSDLDPLPDGNGEENPELAALAIDGDPGTAWQTMEYYRNPQFGNLKEGVGLVVDLGDEQEVGSVQVTTQGGPTGLQVYAAPQGTGAPTDVAGLERVASDGGADGRTDLELRDPVTTRYLVVWLTSLPPEGGNFRGKIAEIVVRP